MWETESTVPGLIEGLRGQGYVEGWIISAKTKIDEEISPWVVEVEVERSTGQGPDSSVGRCRLVNIGTLGY
jgi:hypothetical protein